MSAPPDFDGERFAFQDTEIWLEKAEPGWVLRDNSGAVERFPTKRDAKKRLRLYAGGYYIFRPSFHAAKT